MLTVGTDTYISQADATAYVIAHYVSTDPRAIAWAALSSDNKDAHLRKAAQTVDRQPVVGIKALSTQTMQFPRAIFTNTGAYQLTASHSLGSGWYIQPEVPADVKAAQVEIALELSVGISTRTDLQRQGVKSFSLGKLSENYGSGKANALPYEARELMAAYLLGGAAIC